MDSIDRRILGELQRDGRVAIAELAERVGLSTTPCWRRVRRLEESGVIRGYTALLSPRALGLAIDMFVYVTMDHHQAEAFEAAVAAQDEIVECYAMTGAQDYLLHVVVADIDAYDRFVREDLRNMPGVDRVRTSLAMKTIKQGVALPLTGGS